MDFVPNHTSDQHPWFLESRSSRDNPKRDWYIWRDPRADGGPPNNWRSNFGGSAWALDPVTGQYFYHAFLTEQPDLNWRNRAVCNAMFDVLRFWLDRGVDGFRVDVMWHLIKDDAFRDNPPDPGYRPGDPGIREFLQVYSADRPEVHRIVADMRKVIDAYPDRVLIGEIYLPLERLVAYYGQHLSGANLPFNFQLIEAPWHAREVGRIIREYEAALPAGGWPNWVLSNHDKARIASRVGLLQARVAAMLLLTLRGTPTLYYGDEIGMEGASIPADQARDSWERSEPGLGVSRDPARTPMQWDASPNAGFHHRPAVAAARAGLPGAQRRGPGRRPGLDPDAGPAAHRPAPAAPGPARGRLPPHCRRGRRPRLRTHPRRGAYAGHAEFRSRTGRGPPPRPAGAHPPLHLARARRREPRPGGQACAR